MTEIVFRLENFIFFGKRIVSGLGFLGRDYLEQKLKGYYFQKEMDTEKYISYSDGSSNY